ncbi:MAG: type II toxin-antitoxin system VapB family antitoxin [Cyanobacteriota bacterium]
MHAMARELAARRSTTFTDAVRQAPRAELERCPIRERLEAIEARKPAIRAICARTSDRHAWPYRTSKELQDALYDDHRQPV